MHDPPYHLLLAEGVRPGQDHGLDGSQVSDSDQIHAFSEGLYGSEPL